MEDGNYAADATGYVVSVLNNELTIIDIPTLASRALETRDLERNADLLPPAGSTIWMTIEPAGDKTDLPAGESNAANQAPATITRVSIDAAGQIKLDDQPVALESLAEKYGVRKDATVLVSPDGADPALVKKVVDTLTAAGASISISKSLAAQGDAISNVHIDPNKIDDLKARWQKRSPRTPPACARPPRRTTK